MEANSLVLTANRRLTRWLETEYARQKQAQGQLAWTRPKIYSLTAWYHQQWQTIQNNRLAAEASRALLSPLQEKCLWQQLFSNNNLGYELLNENDTAELAREAWQNLRLWCQSSTDLPDYSETAFLKNLISVFEHHCQQNALLDSTTMMQVVTRAFEQAKLPSPQNVVLYGFQDLPPLTQKLFRLWQSQQCEFSELVFSKKSPSIALQACLNESDEIAQAAHWAESILTRANEEQPPRIAIVVPDLTRLRARIEHIFHQRFEPQFTFAKQARHSPGFNISAGQALADTPPIAAAFNALELNQTDIDAGTLSHILRSPYLGNFDELEARAQLETMILNRQGRKIRRSRLYALCAEFAVPADQDPAANSHPHYADGNPEDSHENSALPNFYKALGDFQNCSRGQQHQKLSCLEWAELFHQQLQALGWPGSRTSNTLEYQQIQKWPDVLEAFASLDLIAEHKPGFAQAIRWLRMCARQPFQAQTLDSPIQILGLLEAAGLPFEHLRILQMDDQHWPQSCEPNPFLPASMQRELAMPRASYEGELRYAEKLTRQFSECANDVVFSYSKTQEDRELLPSPFIRTFLSTNPPDTKNQTHSNADSINDIDYFSIIAKEKTQVQAFVDSCGPLLKNVDHIRGGTQVLKDQAACYFQAFAKHRLGIEADERKQPGIDARDRGILIHQSLDALWRKLKNQQRLLALTEHDLEQLVHECVEQSRLRLSKDPESPRLLELECKRSESLLLAWLQLEKQRGSFRVAQQEKMRKLKIATLPLHIRADRVDELADGSLFVIDYKTGNPDLRAWAGERPDEPQIPLYALANEERISAAAFGLLNASRVEFKGLAKTPQHTPGLVSTEDTKKLDLPATWEGVLQHWHAQLEKLARAFLAGDADVNPKNPAQTCRYCGLHALCRVKEYIADDEEEQENIESQTNSLGATE